MGSPKSIAIADDDDDHRSLLADVLREAGHQVRVFPDGDSLWSAFDTPYAPDVLILDLMMPGFDGVEVLSMLKDRAGSPAVIVVSGATQLADEALALGAVAVFGKPFDLDALCLVVEA